METISLEKLPARQSAKVRGFKGNKALAQRLSDLGLTPNSEVIVLRSSKKSPIDILVRRTRLAIAHDIAKCVLVEVIA